MKRKAKSRLTKVDLDAVLKLQSDYEYLQSECRRMFTWVYNLSRGREIEVLKFTNQDLDFVVKLISEYAKWERPTNTTENNE